MRKSRSQFTNILSTLCVVAIFAALPASGQQPQNSAATEKSKTAEFAERISKFAIAWGPGLNSTGGMMELKEVSREKVKAETVVSYRITTTGLPMSSTYSLVIAGFNYVSITQLEGVTLDETGQANCAPKSAAALTIISCGNGGDASGPLILKISAAMGEPKHYGLVSHDHLWKAFVTLVPFPVEATDGLCSLEEILLTPKAEGVLIKGMGFAANSEVRLRSNSTGESRDETVQIDARGNFYHAEVPYVEGKSNGITKLTAQSKSCSPALTFTWGKDSYKIQ